jgi:HEAT repeat protein
MTDDKNHNDGCSAWLLLVCRVSIASLAAAACLVPATALAQHAPGEEKSKQQPNKQTPRFSETFDLDALNKKIRLQIEPTVSNDEWQVHIVTGKDLDTNQGVTTQLREPLPGWISDDHYGFEVVSEALGKGVTAVILAALPGMHGDGPPSGTQFQVVWTVENRRGQLDWRRLDTAQYSSLDGGTRFEFQQDGQTHQLVRQRRGNDSLFCGESAVDPILFDRYDTKQKSFQQALDIESLVKEAPVLKATRGSDTFNPPSLEAWYQWFGASSDRRSPNRQGALIRPLELGDGQVDTGWMEGRSGLGRGEFVSSQINDAVELRAIRIVPGTGANKSLFDAFARPSKVLVGLSDGSRYVVELGEVDFEQVQSGRGVVVDLPDPKKTRCLSVMLLDAERGEAVKGQPSWTRDTTLIAEITPYSVVHADDAPKTARRLVAAISNETNARNRRRIAELSLTIEGHLVDEVRRVINQDSADKRRRVIPLMASLPADTAVPMLIDLLRKTVPTAPEYRAIKRSLAAHYVKSAPALVTFLAEDSTGERKQIDVLRLLGRVGEPSHLTGLIDSLGQGETAVRNERIRAVAAGERPLVEPLVTFASKHVDTGAGYDALRTLGLIGRRVYYKDQGELSSSATFAQLLQDTNERRSLMRALAVARSFRVRGFVEMARERFISHNDALVRRAAIEALGRYDSEQARKLLVDALDDESPDVRIAAVSAIGQRDDAPQIIDDVLEYSHNEGWKAGLRQAFRVLATVENQATTEAFATRLHNEPNADASLWAAQALDRARRPVRAELAESLIKDPEVRLEMRLAMFDLLGLDSTERGERFLLEALDHERWTELADATRAEHRIRDRIILSLGRRRSQKAMPKLLDIARSAKETDVRQIALRSLAFYQDEALLLELQRWKPSVAPELENILDQAITMIERRRSLSSVTSDLDEVLDKDEDKSETNPSDDASNGRVPNDVE